MARTNALEQYIIDTISIPAYFNRFLADKKKGIVELHEETSTATICPFHDDVNPSFRYWKAKRFFMCFGCHVAGDVINLHRLRLQRQMGVSVSRVSAVNDLCKLYNIQYKGKAGKGAGGIITKDNVEVADDISVFERCRRSLHLSDALRENRKHFNFLTFKQQNDSVKNGQSDWSAKFKAYEELDLRTCVAINATDDRFSDFSILEQDLEE